MSQHDRRRQTLENLVRLRRAERAYPESRDIAAVRASLEQELGGTVSQRLAASLLGVSHTAIRNWVKKRDIPVVHNADGREQIPLDPLLDLHDDVVGRRETGERRLHVLEPTMAEDRARAEELKPRELLSEHTSWPDPHRRAELRSLAYHRAVARRLRRTMVDDALHQLWQWREQGKIDPRYADRWEALLKKPLSQIRSVLSEDSSYARDLRQNSPFAGALSEAERRKILQEIR
jgi:hypothetical protein